MGLVIGGAPLHACLTARRVRETIAPLWGSQHNTFWRTYMPFLFAPTFFYHSTRGSKLGDGGRRGPRRWRGRGQWSRRLPPRRHARGGALREQLPHHLQVAVFAGRGASQQLPHRPQVAAHAGGVQRRGVTSASLRSAPRKVQRGQLPHHLQAAARAGDVRGRVQPRLSALPTARAPREQLPRHLPAAVPAGDKQSRGGAAVVRGVHRGAPRERSSRTIGRAPPAARARAARPSPRPAALLPAPRLPQQREEGPHVLPEAALRGEEEARKED
jgi:hypothetical protein